MHIEIDRSISQRVKICITGHEQEVLPPVAEDWAFQVVYVINQARSCSHFGRTCQYDETWFRFQNVDGRVQRGDFNELLDIGEEHGASFMDWIR